MRSSYVIAIVALLPVMLSLGMIGCKRTPGSQTGDEMAASTTEEGAERTAEQPGEKPSEKEAEEAGRPGMDPEGLVQRLTTGTDKEKLAALQNSLGIDKAAHDPDVREAVRKLAIGEDTTPEIQAVALRAWMNWVEKDPEPALRGVDSRHTPVRLAAARALGLAKDSKEVRAALRKLKQDPDSTVAAAATESLADVLRAAADAESAIRALVADLGNPEADRSALSGMRLEQRGRRDRRVIDILAETLLTSKNPAQRASCATIIGLASAGTNPGQAKFASSVRVLSRAPGTPPEAYTGGVPALMKAAESDPDPVVREAAVESLGFIGAPEAAPVLGKALKDPDPHVRRRAASALIVVSPDEVKDQLIEAALHDPVAEVRRFAVEAMANLKGEEAAESVALCLRDSDPEVRRYAAEVLGRIGTSRYTEALLRLFDDIDEDVRWKAVEAVAGFVDKRAQKALLNALWDPSPRVALAAERGLHALGIGKRVLTKAERFRAPKS